MKRKQIKGVGLGYLPSFHQEIFDHQGKFDFIEVQPEAFMGSIGRTREVWLNDIAKTIPASLHGTELSFASHGPVPFAFLQEVKKVAEILKSPWYSEHLSFTQTDNFDLDLYLPPLFCEENLERLADRYKMMEDALGINICLENVVNFLFIDKKSGLSEAEFSKKLTAITNLKLILNLDSILVSSFHLNIKPQDLLLSYPLDKVESITMVPETSMNSMVRKLYGNNINQRMLELLKLAIDTSSANSVLIQRRYETETYSKMAPFIGRVKEIFYYKRGE